MRITKKVTDVGVVVGATTVLTETLVGVQYPEFAEQVVSMSITNTGAAALTSFEIEIQLVDGGDWVTYLADADWSAAPLPEPLILTDTALASLAAAGTSLIIFRLYRPYAMRVRAAGGTTLTIEYCF